MVSPANIGGCFLAKQGKPTGKHQMLVSWWPGGMILMLRQDSKRKAVATLVTTAFRMNVSYD
ncbi:MAG: hypothetical protein RL160_1555 [Bacteroidota bacterium]|jgi:hypothetical protein